MGADLQIRLLGAFEMRTSSILLPSMARKAKLLIARLAVQPDHRMDREALAAFLWPGSDPAAARASLRQALVRLRAALDAAAPVLITDAGSVALDRASVLLDLDQIASARAPDLMQAGEFLEGTHALEPELQEWLEIERRHYSEAILARFEAVLSDEMTPKSRIVLGLRRISIDPLNEAAHRDLMTAFWKDRRRGQALQQYRTLQKLLDAELGVGPEDQTTALFNMIRTEPGGSDQRTDVRADTNVETEDSIISLRFVVILRIAEEEGSLSSLKELPDLEKSGGKAICGGTVVFGLQQGREDDAIRALRLAQMLRQRKGDTGFGISAGLVSVEGDRISGTAVSIADRLAFVAESGEILVNDAVSGLAAAVAQFNSIKIRGRQVWQANQIEEGSARPRPLFVGRIAENAHLGVLLQMAQDGQAGAVLLSGGPGIGKTRLTEEQTQTAYGLGMAVVRVGFSPTRGELDSIEMRLGRAIGSLGDTLQSQVRPSESALVRCLIDQFMDMPEDRTARARLSLIDRGHYSQLIVTAMTRLLASLCRGALVIVEDCHWAEEDERDLLIKLTAAIAGLPVLLMMTERPAEEMLRPALLAESMETPVSIMTLSTLRESEARALARSFPGASDALTSRILDRAAGNPLFIVRLAEAGDLSDDFPPSVIGLAQQQLDRLTPNVRFACQCATTLGHKFKRSDFDEIFADAETSALIGSGFFQLTGDIVSFEHALIHEAIYQTLSESDKNRLHLRAAQHFELRDVIAWAKHALASGDGSLAARSCAVAADFVLPQNRFALGERFIDAGLEAGGTANERAVLLLCRGSSRREKGLLDEASEIYSRALDSTQDRDLRIQIIIRLAWVHEYNEDTNRAEELLAQADVLAASGGISDVSRCELLSAQGRRAYFVGDHERSLTLQQEAHDIAGTAGLTLQRLRALGGLGEAHYSGCRLQSSVNCYRACVEEADQQGLAIVSNRHRHMYSYAANLLDPGPASRQLVEMSVERTKLEASRRNELAARIDMLEFAAHNNEREVGEREIETINSMIKAMTGNSFRAEYDVARSMFAFYVGDKKQVAAIAEPYLKEPLQPYLGPTFAALRAWAAGPGTACDNLLAIGADIFSESSIAHTAFHFHHIAARAVLDRPDRAIGYLERLNDLAGDEPIRTGELSMAALKQQIGRPDRPYQAIAEELDRCNLRAFLFDLGT